MVFSIVFSLPTKQNLFLNFEKFYLSYAYAFMLFETQLGNNYLFIKPRSLPIVFSIIVIYIQAINIIILISMNIIYKIIKHNI